MKLSQLVLAAAISVSAGSAFAAGCKIDGRVSIVGNEFPAIHAVVEGAKSCIGDEIKANLTADHQKINVAGMTSSPAEYTSALISNASIIALLNEDLIRPLDSLVEKYGQSLKPNQLIKINGKIMAVAFMVNAQHLVYRSDILAEAGVQPPKSYEEVLVAAKAIREQELMQYPIGGAYKAGWNLAQEFINMYLASGGEFFEPGSAKVSINNEKGLAALEMMKALSGYMNPDFLTHDSNATNAEFRAGNVAMMNMWGSRAATLTEIEGISEDVVHGFDISGPLIVGKSSVPASTLWWDGFTVAKNVSDADAEATFVAMITGISPDRLDKKTSSLAVWLIDGYKPTQKARGVSDAIDMETKPYPIKPYMGLLHTALGNELSDFMQGKEDAKSALADIVSAYNSAAREEGFLN